MLLAFVGDVRHQVGGQRLLGTGQPLAEGNDNGLALEMSTEQVQYRSLPRTEFAEQGYDRGFGNQQLHGQRVDQRGTAERVLGPAFYRIVGFR